MPQATHPRATIRSTRDLIERIASSGDSDPLSIRDSCGEDRGVALVPHRDLGPQADLLRLQACRTAAAVSMLGIDEGRFSAARTSGSS